MSDTAFSLEQALDIIESKLLRVSVAETVPLTQACGRIAACDIAAHIAVPRHANAAVDGYGFRFADLPESGEARLSIIGIAKAGHAYGGDLSPGAAIKIFTGAPINNPAIDTIIMQENANLQGAHDAQGAQDGEYITFACDAVKRGSNVRARGDDVGEGDTLIKQGARFNPAHIGLLAAQAMTQVSVFQKLKVGLLSGGDELSDSECGTLKEGMIYDSNRPMLCELLRLGGYEVKDYGILADDAAALLSVLRKSDCDVVLASGGMSLGQEDHLRKILAEHGRLDFWQLKCKPGRPAGLGTLQKESGATLPVIGLPGNPVAAFTVYSLLGRAVLARMGGETYREPPSFAVRLGEDFRKKPGRREFVRASLQTRKGEQVAVRCGKVGAGVLSSIASADGFLDFPEDCGDRKAGDIAAFIPMAVLLY